MRNIQRNLCGQTITISIVEYENMSAIPTMGEGFYLITRVFGSGEISQFFTVVGAPFDPTDDLRLKGWDLMAGDDLERHYFRSIGA